MDQPTFKGLNGCYCHPFNSWAECEKAHKQKLTIGTPVENRHTGQQGFIHEVWKDYYFIVKCGVLPRENIQMHSALLIPMESIALQDDYPTLVKKEAVWIEEFNQSIS